MDDGTRGQLRQFGEMRADAIVDAVKQEFRLRKPLLGDRGAFDHHLGGALATHRVERNDDASSQNPSPPAALVTPFPSSPKSLRARRNARTPCKHGADASIHRNSGTRRSSTV